MFKGVSRKKGMKMTCNHMVARKVIVIGNQPKKVNTCTAKQKLANTSYKKKKKKKLKNCD